MKGRRFPKLSTSLIIMISFLLAILVGSILLALPISAADRQGVSYADALFTATTATCVTGLVTLPTVTAWSGFGQVVILLLIQIGGLGVITVMAGLMVVFHRKMSLNDRSLIQDAFNLDSLSGLIRFVKKVIFGTLTVEAVGALLCLPVFVADFGIKGIWIAIFHSVSSFCNAGIDVFATDSLCRYATHPLINTVTALLIVMGGVGYVVWWDVIRVIKNRTRQRGNLFGRLTLHSKIVLTTTLALILAGALAIFLLESNNPLTLKDRSLWDRLQLSLFQSITTRTAGFFTIPQGNLTNGSTLVCLLLMFIGGSPVGTAGGVKTVTIAVLAASALAAIQNKDEPVLWGRSLPRRSAGKAAAVVGMSFATMIACALLLAAVTDASLPDILYEAVSATATVGLSRDLTPTLPLLGKLVMIATMYLGRVGPISLMVAFQSKKAPQNLVKNPTENIYVG